MTKGPRFIWFNWIDEAEIHFKEDPDFWVLEGKIHAFRAVSEHIFHKRILRKKKGKHVWQISDEISGKTGQATVRQLWHSCMADRLAIASSGAREEKECWLSRYYGEKKKCLQIEFQTHENTITTEIEICP